MKTEQKKKLVIKIRSLIALFIVCLVLSGITAFVIELINYLTKNNN